MRVINPSGLNKHIMAICFLFAMFFITLSCMLLTSCTESSPKGSSLKIEQNTTPNAVLVMEANGKQFYPTFANTDAANTLKEKLNSEPLTVTLRDYGDFEKTGPLPWPLPANDERITTEPGDIVLYQGDKICVYYDKNTWEFTRLASIDGTSRNELLDALGKDDVTVRFWLEWSE